MVAVAVNVDPDSILDFGARGLVLTASGVLNARGGAMTIIAASLVLQPRATLLSSGGTIVVGTTGGVELQANADGSGRSSIDVRGSDGGVLEITAGAGVTIAGQLLASATASQGAGGLIDVTGAEIGTTAANASIDASGGGGSSNAVGGEVSLTATATDVRIAGGVTVQSAGDGGAITIEAERDVVTTATASINLKSGAGGAGDAIEITAYGGGVWLGGTTILGSAPGSIDGGGSGPTMSVDAATDITLDAAIDFAGGGVDGYGGSVEFTAGGDVLMRAPIDVSATGSSGVGGSVDIDTTDGRTAKIDVQRDINGAGGHSGADITLWSYGDVRISSRLHRGRPVREHLGSGMRHRRDRGGEALEPRGE